MLTPDRLTIDGKPLPAAGRGQMPGMGAAGRGRAGSGGMPGSAPGGPGGAPAGAAARGAGGFGGFGGGQQSSDPTMRCPGKRRRCSSAPRDTWRPPAAAKGSGCFPLRVGPTTGCRPQLLPRGINHQQDWVRACKGGAPGVSEFSVASKYIEWLALGAIALRVPKTKLMWDAKNTALHQQRGSQQTFKTIRAQRMGDETLASKAEERGTTEAEQEARFPSTLLKPGPRQAPFPSQISQISFLWAWIFRVGSPIRLPLLRFLVLFSLNWDYNWSRTSYGLIRSSFLSGRERDHV